MKGGCRMEFYFNHFSRFAHFFVSQIGQMLIPSFILCAAAAAVMHFIKSVDAAVRYKLWLAVLMMVIIMPPFTTLVLPEFNLTQYAKQVFMTNVGSEPIMLNVSHARDESLNYAVPNIKTETDYTLSLAEYPAPTVISTAQTRPSTETAAHTAVIPKKTDSQNAYSYHRLLLEGFPMIALMLWLFVFLVMIFRIVLGYRGLQCLKASALPLTEDRFRRVKRLMPSFSTKRRVAVRQSDRINVPVSAGFIRPMVVLPAGLIDKLDDRELQAIIVHEMAHLVRFDDWMKLLQKTVTALFFFNPIVLWIGRRLDLERELACDAVVLDIIGQPRLYARCLTKMIQRIIIPMEPTLVTGAILSKKQIFRRIEMILQSKSNTPPLSAGRFAGLILSFIIVAIMAFQTAPALAWPYHPFKFTAIAEVIKEKSDSSTATVFRSEKNEKWQKIQSPQKPLIFLPDEYLLELDSAGLLEELKAALEEVELETLDELFEQPDEFEPAMVVPPVEPIAPDVWVVPGSETRFKKSGDHIIFTPVPDGDAFIDSEEGAKYLDQLAKTNAKYAKEYGEALKKYYALRTDKDKREAVEQEAESKRHYAEAIARARETSRGRGTLGGMIESFGDFIDNLGDDHYVMINHDDDGSVAYEWKQGSDKVRIESEGEFKLNNDDNEIIWMARDALVEISERKAGIKREIRIEPDKDGKPLYAYRYNGNAREFDSEARQWYYKVMIDCVRKTGFNAAERARRIYQKKGLDGILFEIEGIESDYITRLYLSSLIEKEQLNDNELGRLIRFVTRNVDSDYEKAEILLGIAEVQKNEKYLLGDFIEAVRSLDSDYERRRVLSELSLNSEVSTGILLGVLEIAESMDSDYERAQLLLQLSDLQRDDREFRVALMRAIGAMTSDYERSRVIQKFLEEGHADSKIAADVLKLIADMSSDYEKSKILIYLAGHSPRDQKLFDAYMTVIEAMSSDYEVKKSLMALGPFYDLDDLTLMKVLNITTHISSDYERAQILKEMAGEVNRGVQVRRAMLESVDDISSDYESSRILRDIIGKINLDDDDAARDILVQAERISSDYEKAQVLSELIPSIRGRGTLEEDLADVIETIGSDYERSKLYAELYRNTRGKR